MILLIAILIFLFTVYVLSMDDFVFMRKNVSQITLFDIAIISGMVGLFFSRLFYASLHPSFAYFNPLVFFVVPYFPGLSLSGFLIGSSLSLYIFSVRGKLPIGRIFDVMVLSLFPSAVILFFWEGVRAFLAKNIFLLFVYFGWVVIFSLYFFLLKNFLAKSPWRDGNLSIVSLIVFSVMQLLLEMIVNKFKTIPLETSVFAFFIAVLFLVFLIKKLRRNKL